MFFTAKQQFLGHVNACCLVQVLRLDQNLWPNGTQQSQLKDNLTAPAKERRRRGGGGERERENFGEVSFC